MFTPECGDCESTPCVCEGYPESYEKQLEHVCEPGKPFSNFCAKCRQEAEENREKILK